MKNLSVNFIDPMDAGFPTKNPYGGFWAPKGHFSPNCLTVVDRRVFQHTKEQKGALLTAKAHHREELQRVYGKD